jgi:gamma-glutamyltranspeptidase/glutathione hydrolase
VTVWDGRETAPAAARADLFIDAAGQALDPTASGPGGRAVGAPGLLRMLDAAQRAHGKLPWERLFAAATALAEDGAPVSPLLSAAIGREAKRLSRQPASRDALLRADGAPIPAGSLRIDRPLAELLRAVAAGRSDALLGGVVAAEIATTVRTDANPGLLTVDDLAATAAIERSPVCLPYRTHLVCSAGPPSSGGLTLLETLGLLAHAGTPQDTPSADAPRGLAAAHLLVEAERLAQADAAFFLADPSFVRAPVAGLLAADYLDRRAALIDRLHALGAATHGAPSWDEPELRAAPPSGPQHGTSDLVAIDDSGDAVSLNASLQDPFGSGLMVRGVLLNDALTAFSPLPVRDGVRIANQIEPGKRPLTAMAPAMVLAADGKLEMLLGAIGGERIAAELTQTLIEAIDLGRGPAAAVARPQVGAKGDVVELESNTVAVALAAGLQAMGHRTEATPAPGGLSLIEVLSAGLSGAADPRDGEADCAGD